MISLCCTRKHVFFQIIAVLTYNKFIKFSPKNLPFYNYLPSTEGHLEVYFKSKTIGSIKLLSDVYYDFCDLLCEVPSVLLS